MNCDIGDYNILKDHQSSLKQYGNKKVHYSFLFSVYILINGVLLGQKALQDQPTMMQSKTQNLYDRNAIYLHETFWDGTQYVQNGQAHGVGLFYSNLIDAVSSIQEAKSQAEQGRRYLQYGFISDLMGISLAFSVALRAKTPEELNRTLSDGLIVYLGSLLVSGNFRRLGYNKIHQAIWTYNREYTSGTDIPAPQVPRKRAVSHEYKHGLSVELLRGKMWVLGVNGYHYNLKIGQWITPHSSRGVDISYAPNLGRDKDMDFWRIHLFRGWYLRKLGIVYPYIVGSFGIHSQSNWENLYPFVADSLTPDKSRKYWKELRLSYTIRVGLALEVGNLRLSTEQGGGSMGTGHIENNISLSYALRPLPRADVYQNYSIMAGVQTFSPFTGKYKGETGGFDFNLQVEKNGRMRNYNAGIFFTDYLFSTGVFHYGAGWKYDNGHRLFDYIDVIPGYQLLLWAEPDPDFILPAGSLEVTAKLRLWKFMLFVRTRTIATVSFKAGLITGALYSFGIGLAI